jgi:hypothetical protein
LDTVRDATKKLHNSREKQILQNACKHENMPRKKKPFINFLKSSGKCRDPEVAEKVWENLQQCLVWATKAAPKESDDGDKAEVNAPAEETEA